MWYRQISNGCQHDEHGYHLWSRRPYDLDPHGTCSYNYGSMHTSIVSQSHLIANCLLFEAQAATKNRLLTLYRRMLYRELKSSGRSYFRSASNANRYNIGTQATNKENKTRRTTRYGHDHRQYGRNSVVIMSTAGWQESQEALQDVQPGYSNVSPNMTGIVKTEEVNVQHQRLSKISGQDSFELSSLDSAYKKEGERSDNHWYDLYPLIPL